MENVTILNWITLGIAIYGALLSTLITIQKWWNNKRSIHINCYYKERSYNENGELYRQIIGIKAVNSGHRPVNIEFCSFYTNKKNDFPYTSNKLPKLIGDGESVDLSINIQYIKDFLSHYDSKNYLKEISFHDAEGNVYKTKILPPILYEEDLAKKSWYQILF